MGKDYAVVFDMDGLLFDTHDMYKDADEHTAQEFGFEFDKEAITDKVGGSTASYMEMMRQLIPEEDTLDQYFKETYLRLEDYSQTYPLKEMKGARELLTYLKDQGAVIGIASNSMGFFIENLLDRSGLGPFFDFIVCDDDVEQAKPAPDLYLLAHDRAGRDKARTYAVEDSTTGLMAAHRAGLQTILVPDREAPSDYSQSHANYIVSDLHEVQEIFQKIFN